MDESVEQILNVLKPVWERKWIVLLVATLVCAVGWPYVYRMPDQYNSMARVFINSQSMLTPLLRGLAVDSNTKERLADITRRTLLSRPNLEIVVRETDLDLAVRTPHEMEVLLQDLAEEISVSGGDREDIYIISYKNEDPVLAKEVVSTLLSIFVENTLGVARKDNTVTERFLDDQIKEYERRLINAEERLKEFKRANVGLMPTEAGGYYTKLEVAAERLAQARLDLREAEQRRNQLHRQIEGDSSGGVLSAGNQWLQTAYDERILLLEERLDELLLQYTDKHPDVIAITRSIDELKRLKQEALEQIAEGRDAGGPQYIGQSNVYQELQIALARVEADVSGLRVRVNEYEKRVAALRQLVDTIPRVEAELAKLNRGYDITKENYETLVNRRESAKISREADQSIDDIQFRIIDPPFVPLVPVGPNRQAYLTVVLAFGFGAGCGLAWFLFLLKPTFMSSRELREFTDLPVLGSVSLVMTRIQIIKNNIEGGIFVLLGLILVTVYAALMLAQRLHVEIF